MGSGCSALLRSASRLCEFLPCFEALAVTSVGVTSGVEKHHALSIRTADETETRSFVRARLGVSVRTARRSNRFGRCINSIHAALCREQDGVFAMHGGPVWYGNEVGCLPCTVCTVCHVHRNEMECLPCTVCTVCPCERTSRRCLFVMYGLHSLP